jgi:hypothetical protein
LRANPAHERALRHAGRRTAEHYTWPQILQRHLFPRLRLLTCASFSSGIAKAAGSTRDATWQSVRRNDPGSGENPDVFVGLARKTDKYIGRVGQTIGTEPGPHPGAIPA